LGESRDLFVFETFGIGVYGLLYVSSLEAEKKLELVRFTVFFGVPCVLIESISARQHKKLTHGAGWQSLLVK
jgi:predicted permease